MHQGNDCIDGKCPECGSKNIESDEAFFGDWVDDEDFLNNEEIAKEPLRD